MSLQQPASATPREVFGWDRLISAVSHKVPLSSPYLIKNLIFPRQVSIFAGPSNLGKTCITCYLAAHVALGKEVVGNKVTKAAVLYVAAEDALGVTNRASLFFDDDNSDFTKKEKEDSTFMVYDGHIDLSSEETTEKFIELAAKVRKDADAEHLLIIFDTLNLCIGDKDENSASDISPILKNVRKIAEAANAHVMLIHHMSHADKEKPRGSTALIGNSDSVFTLHAIENGPRGASIFRQLKQRSAPKGADIYFALTAVEKGKDQDGDPIRLPKAKPVEGANAETGKAKEIMKQSFPVEASTINWLTKASMQDPERYFKVEDIYKGIAAEQGWSYPPANETEDASKKRSVQRAFRDLLRDGKIERRDEKNWNCRVILPTVTDIPPVAPKILES